MTHHEQLLAAMAEERLTARGLAARLRLPLSSIRPRLRELVRDGRAHICRWDREEAGGRLYPRAVYAPGAGRRAPRPPPLSRAEYNRRHRQRLAWAVPSVFHLGVRARDRRAPVDLRVTRARAGPAQGGG